MTARKKALKGKKVKLTVRSFTSGGKKVEEKPVDPAAFRVVSDSVDGKKITKTTPVFNQMERVPERQKNVIPEYSKTITLTIENCANSKQAVSLFSLEKQLPNRVFVDAAESDYEFLKKVLLSKDIYTTGFRMYSPNMWQFSNVLRVSKKDIHGYQAQYPLIAAQYISPYQYQIGIIDINNHGIKISPGVELEVNIEPKTSVTLTFFCNDFKNDEEFFKHISTHHKNYKSDFKQFPILIENRSNVEKEVVLFDRNKIYDDNGDIKVGCLTYSYVELINEMPHNNKINRLKAFSLNKNQITKAIKAKQFGKDGVIPGLSKYQFQDNIIDIEFKYKWSEKDPLKIMVAPKTQVLYLFYEYKTELEIEKEQFIRDNSLRASMLGLDIVKSKPKK
jgi:hypothetical protein